MAQNLLGGWYPIYQGYGPLAGGLGAFDKLNKSGTKFQVNHYHVDGNCLGGFDFSDKGDHCIPFDFDSTGLMDHVVAYRPGKKTHRGASTHSAQPHESRTRRSLHRLLDSYPLFRTLGTGWCLGRPARSESSHLQPNSRESQRKTRQQLTRTINGDSPERTHAADTSNRCRTRPQASQDTRDARSLYRP